ncbi:hypothetical protein LZT09_13925 [Vibrio fluvialis]|uniref:hypothetical protein n=1 Tax=Vibrio fluvialis TaxID=676 RepID=UPI001F46E0FB|nr:hypothetical protein [Vibrio fluvialis]MCE7615726.1 hypothetical protein [Vibrio fluvialis]
MLKTLQKEMAIVAGVNHALKGELIKVTRFVIFVHKPKTPHKRGYRGAGNDQETRSMPLSGRGNDQ